MKHIGYIGANTDEKFEGIRIVEADDETGAIRTLDVVRAQDPIYMAVNAAKTRLYTSIGDSAFGPKGRNGGVAVWAIDGAKLAKLDQVATGRTTPCHISLTPDGSALVFAEYSCGTAGRVALKADGTFDKPSLKMVESHGETGPNKPRQDKPHCHCAIVSPDGRYDCVVDLGLDRVKVYDAAMNELVSKTCKTEPAGAGPRHIIFHPNGQFAFVIFELDNYVTSYRYADGAFTAVQQLSLLPDEWGHGAADKNDPLFSKAAAIKLSEDGTELYCSNRGHDSIAVFAVDPGTGLMSRRGILKLGGKFPRDFTFMPGGRVLVACLKMSGIVRTYRYDRAKCEITPVQDIAGLHRPLYVNFL